MYCSRQPQPLKRCEECWAAAREECEHKSSCASRLISMEIPKDDVAHSKQTRLIIKCENGNEIRSQRRNKSQPVLKTEMVANNTEAICLYWTENNTVKLIGPKTMYFRIVVVTKEAIQFRIDVTFGKYRIRLIGKPIEELNNHYNALETSAVLQVAHKEQKITIRSGDEKEFDEIFLRFANGNLVVSDRFRTNERSNNMLALLKEDLCF